MKKTKYAISLCALLLPGMVMASDFTGGVGDWAEGANWNTELVPSAGDVARVIGANHATVSTAGATAASIEGHWGGQLTVATGGALTVGDFAFFGRGGTTSLLTVDGGLLYVGGNFGVGVDGGGDGLLTLNSGTLNANGGWLIGGYAVGRTGDIVVNGGTLNTTGHLYAGLNGIGSFTVNNGDVNLGGQLLIGNLAGSTGHVTINGGQTSAAVLALGAGTATLDLTGGQLIIAGGVAQSAGSTFNIGAGELLFTGITLADVNWAIDNGAGTWNFAGANGNVRSVTDDGLGTITVSSGSIPPTEAATMVGSSVSSGIVKIVVDTPSALNYYHPMASSNLAAEAWGRIPHSDDGVNAFVVTNLDYATAEGTNAVIYLQVDTAQKFFIVEGDQP